MDIQVTTFETNDDHATVFTESSVEMRTNDYHDMRSPRFSRHTECKRYLFVEWPAGHNHIFENLDRRHLGVCLSGQVRFITSEGASKVISRGQTWQFVQESAPNLTAEVIGNEPFQCVIVQLD